jgi:predicted dehydrogenase
MNTTRRRSRRAFVRRAAAGGLTLGAAPLVLRSHALGAPGQPSAGERIAVGMIGVGDHGTQVNIKGMLGQKDAQIVAVCDVDGGRMQKAREMVEKHYAGERPGGTYKGCDALGDWREIVGRKDIDAVVVSTPDHWHAPISIAAIRAGKDVLCEKPVTVCVHEGRVLAEACEKAQRVFRVATEFRTGEFKRMAELVRAGRIGKIQTIRVKLPAGGPRPVRLGLPVPQDLNWDLWLGPAPQQPYFEYDPNRRCHFHWRWNFDFGTGYLGDWGGHLIDNAMWGNNTERIGPVRVEGKGVMPESKPPDRVLLNPTFATFEVAYEFADGVKLIVKEGGTSTRFEGSDGWVQCGYGKKMTASSPDLEKATVPPEKALPGEGEHSDFVKCVKSRKESNIPAEVAHRVSTLFHLGNIAMRLGRAIRWDPKAERAIDDEKANAMLARPMRAPWSL